MAVATRRRLAVPTAVAVAGGAVLAVQAYVNGRLGRSLGSPEHAAVINNVVGLAVLVALTVTTRGAPRAVRRWRDVRAWYLLGGLGGAMFVAAGAIAAPRIGVALLSLALVCGQTTGSLVADRLGLSPAGRQHITAIRLLGVGLAVVAVAVSALGAHTRPEAGVLAFALLAGVASSFQQAANGRLARATGEPIFASAVNFAVGAVALVAAAAIMTGLSPEHGWSGPPTLYLGGLLGAAVATAFLVLVSRMGVLRLIVAAIAGQALGGLAVDLVAPIHGERVTAATVAGVALTFAAVAVISREGQAPR